MRFLRMLSNSLLAGALGAGLPLGIAVAHYSFGRRACTANRQISIIGTDDKNGRCPRDPA